MLRYALNMSQKKDNIRLPYDFVTTEIIRRNPLYENSSTGPSNLPVENLFPAFNVATISVFLKQEKLYLELFLINDQDIYSDIDFNDPVNKSFANFSNPPLYYVILVKNFWQIVSRKINLELEFSKTTYPHEMVKFARRQLMHMTVPATASLFIDTEGNLCFYVSNRVVDSNKLSTFPFKFTYWDAIQYVTRASLVKKKL